LLVGVNLVDQKNLNTLEAKDGMDLVNIPRVIFASKIIPGKLILET